MRLIVIGGGVMEEKKKFTSVAVPVLFTTQ